MDAETIIQSVLVAAVTSILTSGGLGIWLEYRFKKLALEHEVRFTRLHERRADVIAELYRRLAQAERCFSSLINPLQSAGEPPLEEKWKSAQAAGNEYVTYFEEHRIYFEKDLCDLINTFNSQLHDSFLKFAFRQDGGGLWSAAWKGLSEGLPPIREGIETSFRAILGVTEVSKN